MKSGAAMPTSQPVSRAAMTLLELLIVLIVMVGLLAIAWPSLSRPLADDGLRRAAGVLRDEIELARIEAMQRGQPVVMRLELQTGRGSVDAWHQLLADPTDSVSSRGAAAGSRPNPADAGHPALRDLVRNRGFDLPENVVVVAVAELSADRPEDAASSGDTPMRPADAEWGATVEARGSLQPRPDRESTDGSAWLVFLPDGRSTGRSILLLDQQRGRQLELRYDAGTGLTELRHVRRTTFPSARGVLPAEVER